MNKVVAYFKKSSSFDIKNTGMTGKVPVNSGGDASSLYEQSVLLQKLYV